MNLFQLPRTHGTDDSQQDVEVALNATAWQAVAENGCIARMRSCCLRRLAGKPLRVVARRRMVRHRPERPLLYQLAEDFYPAFTEHLEAQGTDVPVYVQKESEEYLKCGRLPIPRSRLRRKTYGSGPR